jgi:hypothetical protein
MSTTSAKGKKSQIALSGISNHTSGWDLVMVADAKGKRACRYYHNSMLRHLTQDQECLNDQDVIPFEIHTRYTSGTCK